MYTWVIKMFKKNKRTRINLKNKILRLIIVITAATVLLQYIFPIQVCAQEQRILNMKNNVGRNENPDSTTSKENTNNVQITEEIIKEQLESAEIKALKDHLNEFITSDTGELLEKYTSDRIINDAIKGNLNLNIINIFNKITNFFIQEIYVNIHILLELIALIIICAVLNNIQNSFAKEGVAEIAFFVCYIILVSVLIIGFKEASALGLKAIDQMTGFMKATIPIIISLLISSGSITSGNVLRPLFIIIVEITALIIKNIFIPLIFLSVALSIINNISDRFNLDKLAALAKKTGVVIIGTLMTVFIGILTIQGPIAAVADGVANKTLKFALGTFIPVVGSYLADAADTVIGCTLLIKNAAGIAVVIGVISICIIPLLKITALVLLYKITCAITEPISEKRVTACISDIANSMACILGAVAVVTLMFIISVTMIISASKWGQA